MIGQHHASLGFPSRGNSGAQQEAGRAPERVWTFEEEKKTLPLPGVELRIFVPSPITISTELCRVYIFHLITGFYFRQHHTENSPRHTAESKQLSSHRAEAILVIAGRAELHVELKLGAV